MDWFEERYQDMFFSTHGHFPDVEAPECSLCNHT